MKTLLSILIVILTLSLNAQNYTFARGTFNAVGGFQQNADYSSQTAVGEYVQGGVSTDDYTGYLGFLFPLLDQRIPVITSIDDIPNDQGHQVQIVWNKCGFDDYYQFETYYSVWRQDEDFARTDLQYNSSSKQKKTKKKIKKKSSKIYSDPTEIVELARQNPDEIYYWQKIGRDRELWTFISEVPALQENTYSLVAPTLLDSSSSGTNYSTFKVVYHDLYEYFESIPDSGYSVDNIAPLDTRAYIAKNGNDMKISWDEVEYGIFEGNLYPEQNGIWYKIYSSDSPDFVCDVTTYLTTVTDFEYNFLISGESNKFFKVIVSDQP